MAEGLNSLSSLRPVALGRKIFLFVGHDQAGDDVAALYSLVASCELHEVNPVEYLTDVLMRVQAHPASDIDALLPDRWAPSPELLAPGRDRSSRNQVKTSLAGRIRRPAFARIRGSSKILQQVLAREPLLHLANTLEPDKRL